MRELEPFNPVDGSISVVAERRARARRRARDLSIPLTGPLALSRSERPHLRWIFRLSIPLTGPLALSRVSAVRVVGRAHCLSIPLTGPLALSPDRVRPWAGWGISAFNPVDGSISVVAATRRPDRMSRGWNPVGAQVCRGALLWWSGPMPEALGAVWKVGRGLWSPSRGSLDEHLLYWESRDLHATKIVARVGEEWPIERTAFSHAPQRM